MATSYSSNDRNMSNAPSQVSVTTEEEQPKTKRQRMAEEHAVFTMWLNNAAQDLNRNMTCLQGLRHDHRRLSSNLGGRKTDDVKDEQMKLSKAHEVQLLQSNEKLQEVVSDSLVKQGEEWEKLFPLVVEEWTRKERLWASTAPSVEKAVHYFAQVRIMLARIQALDVLIRDKEEGVATRRQSAVSALVPPTLPPPPPPPTTAAEAGAAQKPSQARANQSKDKGKASASAKSK